MSIFTFIVFFSRSGESETVKDDEEEEEGNLISEAQEEQEDSADYIPGTFAISALPPAS